VLHGIPGGLPRLTSKKRSNYYRIKRLRRTANLPFSAPVRSLRIAADFPAPSPLQARHAESNASSEGDYDAAALTTSRPGTTESAIGCFFVRNTSDPARRLAEYPRRRLKTLTALCTPPFPPTCVPGTEPESCAMQIPKGSASVSFVTRSRNCDWQVNAKSGLAVNPEHFFSERSKP
jgi:hypothetical protein